MQDQKLNVNVTCLKAYRRIASALLAIAVVAGFSSVPAAQSINWADPQSPILKAVVTHQRIANEREVGNILVLRAGRPFAGVTRMTLVAGDSLVTGDQTAIIGYADQSWEAVIHPGTQVDFRGGEVKVTFGRMFVQLTPSEQNLLPIAVSSKYGTVTAGDASFEIDVSEDRAVVTVIAGKIDLTRPSSEVVKLQALDEAVLVTDAPVVSRPISGSRSAEIGDRIATLANLGVVSSPGARQTAATSPQPATTTEATGASETESDAAAQLARNRVAQRMLNELGYDAGPADGVAGPRTLRAVAAFRLDRQLPGTTNIDDGLIAALRTAPAKKAEPSVMSQADIAAALAGKKQTQPQSQALKSPQAPEPPQAPKAQTGSLVPDVVGLDFDQARQALIKRNQLIGRVTYQSDEAAAPGTVLRQFPAPGNIDRQNVSIDLVVARAAPVATKAATTSSGNTAAPPPPPPPGSASGSNKTAVASTDSFLGAKGYLGNQDEIASLFRPEQKLESSNTTGANVLSRDELSACLRIEDDYLAQKLRVGASNQKQDATADEIASLDVRLDEILPKTDPNKPETVKAYNDLLDQRLKLFAEYKDNILPAARQNERELRAIERNFQADCGQRPYRADDLEAARKEASLAR
ncbi:PASTA domain-containing protein [Pelagibius sp. Alg239-R121]|uniref:PASTA domain-containing protein n=1 Tax=Pelagibius sp. Alg239-R121 TaxID=2993448 RepID=UPI0024A63E18|nr:PASTA domain-containing protein [Pelagibius sp. Alg239-R121]